LYFAGLSSIAEEMRNLRIRKKQHYTT
jgi:hypothetical protein